MNDYAYAVVLTLAQSPGMGYFVTCRDLPQLLVVGDDMADAFRKAEEALDLLLSVDLAENKRPPAPSPMRPGEYLAQPSAETLALLIEYFGPG